ncbi:sugar ABC transporter permease [Trebonia kvetii]|uniref:Sugar ABC transporter permease n=1 Tax=Trebonia kvetii TaxID=2480626 RepID=A0A6P2C3W9_9ACTN|nr:sugar ABC transporter permease [Trebonia kvetii]TVZ05637.1 sugar ABC transporter permease [Trebonia kvetii]
MSDTAIAVAERRRSGAATRGAGTGAGAGTRSAPYLTYLLPATALFAVVIAVPLVMNIYTSFTRWTGVGPRQWAGLANYRQLWHDSEFWASMWHSLALVAAMAVIPTVLGLLVAAALFDVIAKRFSERTASLLRACIYLPQVLPIIVAAIVWGWILDPQYGALNVALRDVGLGFLAHDLLGDPHTALLTVMAVLIWFQLGYPVVIFMAALQRTDPALNEAAEIDGATWRQRLWSVVVPQIRPEIYVVLLTCTVASLRAFGWIYALTSGGPGVSTQVPSYYSYQSFFTDLDVGYGSAIATVMTLIIVVVSVVFLWVQRRHAG